MKPKSLFYCLFWLASLAWESRAMAQDSPFNHLALQSGYEIRIPELPQDLELREQFLSLSADEQERFYKNRQYILRYMLLSLTKKGVGHYVRWTKSRVLTGVQIGRRALRQGLSHAGFVTASPEFIPPNDGEIEERVIRFDRVSPNLRPEERAYAERALSAVVNSLWERAPSIARSSGFGMSFVGGVTWNTHLGNRGFLFGRSLAMDVGVNFHSKEGYIRFYYDQEHLQRGRFALDVGLLFNTMMHLTDAELRRGDLIEGSHQKLPPVGSYRRSSTYNGWGVQFGLHMGDMVGLVLTSAGMPQGLMLVPAMRYLGFVTVYRSSLRRRVLGQATLRANNPLLRALGIRMDEGVERAHLLSPRCHQVFASSI